MDSSRALRGQATIRCSARARPWIRITAPACSHGRRGYGLPPWRKAEPGDAPFAGRPSRRLPRFALVVDNTGSVWPRVTRRPRLGRRGLEWRTGGLNRQGDVPARRMAPSPRDGGAGAKGHRKARRSGKGQSSAAKGGPSKGAEPAQRDLPPPPPPMPINLPKDAGQGSGAMQAAPSDGGPHVQILHNLLGALNQSRQDLPPAILELLDAQTSVDHKAESRALHKLVSTQATAKQELQQVRQAYLAQWSQYMQQLCSTWESSLQEKEAMLASL